MKAFINDTYLVVLYFHMYFLEYALCFRHVMIANMNEVHEIM